MRRRNFIQGIAVFAVWPLPASAQQSSKLPTIGYLGATTASVDAPRFNAFLQRLGELGWIEGRTVAIERQYGEGSNERYSAIAEEFVRRNVNIIVTSSIPAVVAAKHATSAIPIVFASAGDPTGLLTTLSILLGTSLAWASRPSIQRESASNFCSRSFPI